jgi:nickel-type superoxide dismutase maturation protease
MSGRRHHHTHIGRSVGAVLAAIVAVAGRARPRRVVVEGQSMLTTLEPGDQLLIGPFGRLRPGMIVALRDPRGSDRLMVKRVAGVHHAKVDVRGDNPSASTDSRHFGLVEPASIVGRVLYRYGPRERAGRIRQ